MNVSINTTDKAESSEVLHGAPAIGTVHICPPLETQAFGSPEFSTLSKGLEASVLRGSSGKGSRKDHIPSHEPLHQEDLAELRVHTYRTWKWYHHFPHRTNSSRKRNTQVLWLHVAQEWGEGRDAPGTMTGRSLLTPVRSSSQDTHGIPKGREEGYEQSSKGSGEWKKHFSSERRGTLTFLYISVSLIFRSSVAGCLSDTLGHEWPCRVMGSHFMNDLNFREGLQGNLIRQMFQHFSLHLWW